MKAVAVAFSMAWQADSREGPDGDAAAGRLAVFRRDLYRCFRLRATALNFRVFAAIVGDLTA